MQRARINIRREAQLSYAPKPLKIRVVYQIQEQAVGYGYEAIDGVVEDFFPVIHCYSARVCKGGNSTGR